MRRRLIVPEVLQLGAADCGPAVLAAAARGLGRRVDIADLRRRLGCDAEGTSLGALERVACELGLEAEQVMVPAEHLLEGNESLPLIVVTRLEDGRTHFLLLWQRLGQIFLVMDPASGRRMVSAASLLPRLYFHELEVAAADWRDWAATPDFLAPLRRRLGRLGLSPSASEALVADALDDPTPRALAALDAGIRCVAALVRSHALRKNEIPERLTRLLGSLRQNADPAGVLGKIWWSALPREAKIHLRGALLLRLRAAPIRAAKGEKGSERQPKAAAFPGVLAFAAVAGMVGAVEGLGLAGVANGIEGEWLA